VKLAVCFGGPDSAATLRNMLAAQRARPEQAPAVRAIEPHAAIGWLCRPEEARHSWVRQTADGSVLAVAGLPISTATTAAQLLDGILDAPRPEDRLTQLDGAFAAVLWDARRQRLIVVTDFLGLQPLYCAHDGGRLLIASEIKGVAAAMSNVEMDPEGWGAFVSMGHFLGDTTSAAGIRRVPAASVLLFDAAGRKVDERQYWRWRAIPPAIPDTAEIATVLEREVREYARYHAPGIVLLSGGFDSRLLLSLLRRAGHAPQSLSVAHPGERLDADSRYAQASAAALGVECRVEPPAANFYSSEAYLQYLAANEVANPSLGLFIARVAGCLAPEMGAVWEGVSPGYALAFPRIPQATLDCYLRHRCQPPDAPIHAAARLVFRCGGDMRTAFDRQLTREAAACPRTDAGLLEFEARHQMRNRMGHNPLKVYSNDVLCFTPGLTRDFWTLASSIPYAEKWNFRLYFRLFRERFPEALRTPFCSAGQLWSDRLRLDPFYYAAQLFPPPGAQAAARMWKRWRGGAALPAIAARTVAGIDPSHPDLYRDAVAQLQREGPRRAVGHHAQALLFYWRMWRDVMEGRARLAGEVREEAAA
jgi:hypothetical protein